MPLQQPRPRGTERQHGRRPFRGAVPMLLLLFKSCSSGWRFAGSSWTLARRSICIHSRAVDTAITSNPVNHSTRSEGESRLDQFCVAMLKTASTSCRPTDNSRQCAEEPAFLPGPAGDYSRKAGKSSSPRPIWPAEERPRRTPGEDQYTQYGWSMRGGGRETAFGLAHAREARPAEPCAR